MSDWIEVQSGYPHEGEVVMTKIDDERGARNEHLLIRKNRLWWFTDMSMYVYYSPTHWRRAADQSTDG